jgi:hypothetical protein
MEHIHRLLKIKSEKNGPVKNCQLKGTGEIPFFPFTGHIPLLFFKSYSLVPFYVFLVTISDSPL